jgi:hypothetical protein
MPIGLWDNTNADPVLPFTSWSRGNGRADKNTGEMPAYPAGTYDATFTNMAAGKGYVFGGAGLGAGRCEFDGVNDHLDLSLRPPITDASKHTWEIKLKYISAAGPAQALVSQYQNPDNRMHIAISGHELFLLFRKSGTNKLARSSNTLTSFIKDGGALEIYIDSTEVAYIQQDTYDLGDITYSANTLIGFRNSDWPTTSDMYWWAYYSDAISQARITANHGLGKDMSLMGFDDGSDDMKLVAGVPVRRQVPGQIQGQLAGQF